MLLNHVELSGEQKKDGFEVSNVCTQKKSIIFCNKT